MDVRMEGELQMKRDIDERLLRWSDNPRHLPLVLCGARQVGKTYALRELGRSHYDACAYVNLMNKPSQAVFEAGYDARTTLENIEVLTGVKIVPRKTLVIIDEIQEVPAALTLMKPSPRTFPTVISPPPDRTWDWRTTRANPSLSGSRYHRHVSDDVPGIPARLR